MKSAMATFPVIFHQPYVQRPSARVSSCHKSCCAALRIPARIPIVVLPPSASVPRQPLSIHFPLPTRPEIPWFLGCPLFSLFSPLSLLPLLPAFPLLLSFPPHFLPRSVNHILHLVLAIPLPFLIHSLCCLIRSIDHLGLSPASRTPPTARPTLQTTIDCSL